MSSTSQQALKSVREDAHNMQMKVLGVIKRRPKSGATCEEVEEALGMKHQTASARCTELHQRGAIKNNGDVRPTRSGRNAKVWRAA